ncbi:hypothetical protein K439DRAFT_1620091 [Ramaria rubella]|nr:hypothetical protein K439DRAFT_1620091 [Ramaria rubella]
MDVNTSSNHPQHHTGSGTQIRSRVTVCKRLKLKCDSSCLKRDTVTRCTYSAAAAEKIDVQSLHNRVLNLESQLSQLTSGRMKLSSHDLDHAILAVGSSGSSVLVPLDDVAGVWLEHLDLGHDSGINLQPAFIGMSPDCDSLDKREFSRTGSSPHSHPGSIHSSPQPASTVAASLFFFPELYSTYPPAVTPALLTFLPSAQQRPVLLDVLGSVLRMHPSINFPHFRARITAMFSDGSSPEEIGIGPSRADHSEKPTLSFFAAVAAGFALAMQCSPASASTTHTSSPHTSQPSPSPAPSSKPSVSSLLALSSQVLDLVEDSIPYDLDFLHTLVLRCLCMLHDGKMVNVARLMGLARDPDEFTCGAAAKYSLWEAEMRRRMWWDVFYYDLFISDCMGFAPLISDDQHTCRMPADVDEDAFLPKSAALPQPAEHLGASNFSYFVQKCKLAQLVKNMKKRVGHDTSSSPSPSASTSMPAEPSIDAASQAESEIQQYLADLPQAFRLDMDDDLAEPNYATTSASLPPPLASETPPPYLVIQRCELVAIAHQLVLKLFHPFLRRPNLRLSDIAMIASINAAHAVIHASRVAQGVWQKHGVGNAAGHTTHGVGVAAANIPSSHGVFYPFARQLFDATIVAAHVIIQAPQSVISKVALEDVRVALDVLRDPAIATGRGRTAARGGVEGCPSEAVTIVEMMLKKAEMAKRNYIPLATGTKRKHEEVDVSVAKGFWLPYVGTGVATESTTSSAHGATMPTPGNGSIQGSPMAKFSDKPFAPEIQPHHIVRAAPSASTSTRERDKERKYPAVGIRNRVSIGSGGDRKSPGGTSRRRESSVSSVSTPRQQPTASDSGSYGRPVSCTMGPASSMLPEAVPTSTNEFTLSAPYRMDDRHMTEMTVSPTSRFPPQPQAPAPHNYSTQSYQSTDTPGSRHHQPLYDSSSYSSDPPRQPPASFYVPYHPPVVSTESSFRPINGNGTPHSHPHTPQHTHPHIDMMALLPSQNAMDTSDLPRATKQEEGTDRQDPQSHLAGPPFSESEAWPDPGVPRYPAQTHWDSGFSY